MGYLQRPNDSGGGLWGQRGSLVTLKMITWGEGGGRRDEDGQTHTLIHGAVTWWRRSTWTTPSHGLDDSIERQKKL